MLKCKVYHDATHFFRDVIGLVVSESSCSMYVRFEHPDPLNQTLSSTIQEHKNETSYGFTKSVYFEVRVGNLIYEIMEHYITDFECFKNAVLRLLEGVHFGLYVSASEKLKSLELQ
jgi:hypothetical protein